MTKTALTKEAWEKAEGRQQLFCLTKEIYVKICPYLRVDHPERPIRAVGAGQTYFSKWCLNLPAYLEDSLYCDVMGTLWRSNACEGAPKSDYENEAPLVQLNYVWMQGWISVNIGQNWFYWSSWKVLEGLTAVQQIVVYNEFHILTINKCVGPSMCLTMFYKRVWLMNKS